MFIKNEYGEYINARNIIAVEVSEDVHGTHLVLYTEHSKVVKAVADGDVPDVLDMLLHHLRSKYGVHIIHIDNHYLVIEAIDSVLMDAYGLHIKTQCQDFAIVLSDNERIIAIGKLDKYLPVIKF